MNGKKRRGFTLIELIVVIAILAIIAALALPSFLSYQNIARERVCMSNLATVGRTLYINSAVVGGKVDESVVETVMTESLGAEPSGSGYTGLCPSGGTYVVSLNASGSIQIRCTEHGMTAVETINSDTEHVLSLLKYSLEEYFSNRPGNVLNSTGPNFGDQIKEKMADALGISTEYDFRVYKENNHEYKVYVSDPLKDLEVGDMVRVTGYRVKDNVVVKVGDSQMMKVGTESVDGTPIKVISASGYLW